MDAFAVAQRWAETWRRGWEARDVETIVALYHPDAVLSTQPFRVPHRGTAGVRSYVTQALADEEEIRAWFGTPIVHGDRAAVQWWATLREAGREITLAGTSVLRFDSDGLVVDQWDAWNEREGWELLEGWGAR